MCVFRRYDDRGWPNDTLKLTFQKIDPFTILSHTTLQTKLPVFLKTLLPQFVIKFNDIGDYNKEN